MSYILFITTIVIASSSGAGISSAQIQFKTLKECETARDQLMREGMMQAHAICLKRSN